MTTPPPIRSSLRVALARLRVLPGDIPNNADRSSEPSIKIALEQIRLIFGAADSAGVQQPGQTSGAKLEDEVRDFLRAEFPPLVPGATWMIERNLSITRFRQYSHLAEVAKLVADDPTGLLRNALGTEYVIKPDVTVGRPSPLGAPVLHASVSCKATIRSDRVQNARHEANILLHHRRGRAPHIVVVTSEPLPSRLASIAQGTGEIDCTYQVALPELREAVARVGGREERILEELIANGRLADLSDLPTALTF